jgi:acylglycerol lipase
MRAHAATPASFSALQRTALVQVAGVGALLAALAAVLMYQPAPLPPPPPLLLAVQAPPAGDVGGGGGGGDTAAAPAAGGEAAAAADAADAKAAAAAAAAASDHRAAPSPPRMSELSGPRDGGRARYERGERHSVAPGELLATYAWTPEPPARVRAVVLLLHGFRSHARYNFLASTREALHVYGGEQEDGEPTSSSSSAAAVGTTSSSTADAVPPSPGLPSSSMVRELNRIGVACYAHDHVGHGASTGLRSYFASRHVLVGDVIAHARHIKDTHPGIPLFLMGHSLGGTLAVLTALREPALIDGMMLSSAATEPPRNMLGPKGMLLARVSMLGSLLFPTTVVLSLPKNTREPDMQQLFESDPLNSMVQLRARVGHEFLNAYTDISNSMANITTPFLFMSGRYDTLVDPEASSRFYELSRSQDKEMRIQENWHNLLTESGKEANWELFCAWIAARI